MGGGVGVRMAVVVACGPLEVVHVTVAIAVGAAHVAVEDGLVLVDVGEFVTAMVLASGLQHVRARRLVGFVVVELGVLNVEGG